MGHEISVQNREEVAVIRNRQVRVQTEERLNELEELVSQMKKENSAIKGNITKLGKRIKTVEEAQ